MAFGAALQVNVTGEWSTVTLTGDCGAAPFVGQFCAFGIVKVKCAESSDGQPSKSVCTYHAPARRVGGPGGGVPAVVRGGTRGARGGGARPGWPPAPAAAVHWNAIAEAL